MSMFIKVTQINPQYPGLLGVVVRVNIHKIIKYSPSHRNTACIHVEDNDYFDVSESPDDIDRLIEEAKFNQAIDQTLRGLNDS